MIEPGIAETRTRRFAAGLSLRQFLGISCLFCAYVAVSNILYAYSMRTGMAHMTNVSFFAAWDARLLQHVLLLPILLVSLASSLRSMGRPLLSAVPLPGILGAVFAAIAYALVVVSEMSLGTEGWQHAMSDPASGTWVQ